MKPLLSPTKPARDRLSGRLIRILAVQAGLKSTLLMTWGAPAAFLAVLNMIFNFFLGPGVPGEGPDCHFPKEIIGFGPIPARIQ